MRPYFVANLCCPYPVHNIRRIPTWGQRCIRTWVITEPIASKPGILRVWTNLNMRVPSLVARTAIKHEVTNHSPCGWYVILIEERKQPLDVSSFFQRLSI